jgi:hypothetical protein
MRQPKLAKLQEVQDLAARAAPMFLEAISIDGNQTARLLEHNFGDGGGNRFAKQAILMAVLATRIGPSGEFIGARRMPDICRATTHDEAQHHLRCAVFGIP